MRRLVLATVLALGLLVPASASARLRYCGEVPLAVLASPHTSCPFARRIARIAERLHTQAAIVWVRSPVTGRRYRIRCRVAQGFNPYLLCTGRNGIHVEVTS